MNSTSLIIFTDLDGCLLDHNNYSFTAAKPLLQELKNHNLPLIINSSKTKLEIEPLQKTINMNMPFIVENGAAIIFKPLHFEHMINITNTPIKQCGEQLIKEFSISRNKLLLIVNKIKDKYNFKYKGFNDMTPGQISNLTQLSLNDSFLASQRDYSEPILWQDSQSRQILFKELLAEKDIKLQQGGRFLHITSKCNKGDAMQWLLEHWCPILSQKKTVIALGDSMNDISMLEKSDYALVIKNNKVKTLSVQGKIKTIYSTLPASSGWVETLEPLLKQLISIKKESL